MSFQSFKQISKLFIMICQKMKKTLFCLYGTFFFFYCALVNTCILSVIHLFKQLISSDNVICYM